MREIVSHNLEYVPLKNIPSKKIMSKRVENVGKWWEQQKSAHTKGSTNSQYKICQLEWGILFTYQIGKDLRVVIPRISEGRG